VGNSYVIVVGAGAAGMMAAGRAAERGKKVILLEKMEQPGKKILISGRTRCNITNTAEIDDFISMYGENGKFLYHAFHRFFREDLLVLLSKYGVEVKVERGGRIFPSSDNAGDVVRAFNKYLKEFQVEFHFNASVDEVFVEKGEVRGVRVNGALVPSSSVILATGGASFPATGSTGDGYRMAAALGHTIVKLRPALVPLIVEEIDLASAMQGVSLKNVRLTSFRCRADRINPGLTPHHDIGRGTGCPISRPPVIESRLGEMMMTHFGIGGPITLQMSLAVVKALEEGPVSVSVDLKPGLSNEQLRRRLQRDFDTYSKRSLKHIMTGLLPASVIEPVIRLSGVSPDKPGYRVDGEEKERLVQTLKSFRFNIKQPLPLSSAMVTAGGVSLKEVDPYTMSSRLVRGLYFCGEVLDLDADTGGFNLQSAFSTGWLAGENV